MNPPTAPMAAAALDDDDLQRLQDLLAALPEPLQPLDPSALDGYLCGVLLQPQRPAPAIWLTHVADVDGATPPAGVDLQALHALVLRRHAELDAAIGQRQWFDPWVYALEDSAAPAESVLPWVAGFAAAMEHFPALMALPDPELVEPLALLFMHFDPDDLEDADALLAVIETLEPPTDLAEAVQDLVRALMLIADVTRPVNPTKPAGPVASRSTRPRKPGRRNSR
ncbi:MAG: YecA family protein [Pseudomonadota bacterium]|nr:YecA family protein [Pseudomonadota bacterium]